MGILQRDKTRQLGKRRDILGEFGTGGDSLVQKGIVGDGWGGKGSFGTGRHILGRDSWNILEQEATVGERKGRLGTVIVVFWSGYARCSLRCILFFFRFRVRVVLA